MIQILLYGDIKRRVGKQLIEINGDKPLIEILKEIAKRYNIEDLLFRDGNIRGELLILVNGADWNSLGYLNRNVKDGSKIKLVPVWHGG